jgi:lysine 2,3-aminomutase
MSPLLSEELEPPLGEKQFYNCFFNDVTKKEINDWRWQFANRITKLKTLEKFIKLSKAELNAFSMAKDILPLAITPHYMRLIDPIRFDQPLRKSVIPRENEFMHSKAEAEDPLNEDDHSPVPGLVHRYPDRVLFLVTNCCSVNCRYCTRSRKVKCGSRYSLTKKVWQQAINYIKEHPKIRDVLISGGDPFIMDDEPIAWLLKQLRSIPSVEIIRIGTKTPAVLPQRITVSLCKMLRKYHPLYLNIHFTHPDELVPETAKACIRLADSGIPLGSQTVLLSGINDDVDTMKTLMQGLLKIRVKPYYIFQCDPIFGSGHFRTPVSRGLKIIEGLRGHTTGLAVPAYVIDAPGGGGKIQLLPDYCQGWDEKGVKLRNYEGKDYFYPDYVA